MAVQAIRTKDIPEWAAKKAEAKTKKDRKDARDATFAGKTFEDLNNQEKDALLKAIAVRMQLIEDSDD